MAAEQQRDFMPVTDLEIALGQTAASSLSRLLSSLWRYRHYTRNSRIAQALAEYSWTSEVPPLTGSRAQELVAYLESREFQGVATDLCLTQLQAYAKIPPSISSESVSAQIYNGLRQYTHLAVHEVEDLTIFLRHQLAEGISTVLGGSGFIKSMPPEVRSRLLVQARDQGLASLRNSELLGGLRNLAEIHKFEADLREQVCVLKSQMSLQNAGEARAVDFERLYVSPVLSISRYHPDLELGLTNSGNAIRSLPRMVILGDPGGGKSTLAAKNVYDVAARSDPDGPLVPFHLTLREYAAGFQGTRATLVQRIADVCRSPYQLEPPEGAIEYLLLNGHALVVFDGLDELTATDVRRQVVESIEAFAHRYPQTAILVTSRRVGYYETPLNESLFEVAELNEFSRSQVTEYAEKWFALTRPEAASKLTEAFIAESELVSDLRSNPLMLSLMCSLYSAEGYIPANRPEVYEKCATLLFEKWDKQRGITIALPFDAHVKSAIQSMAWWLYTEAHGATGLPRTKLLSYLTDYLHRGRFAVREDAENAASSFIDFCTGRAWVLSNIDTTKADEIYGFTHRTFLEYFAASQLVRRRPDATGLFDELRPHLEAAEWDMLAQLALQVVNRTVENGANDFLRRLLTVAAERPVLVRSKLLCFAARCLSFVVPSPRVLADLTEALLEFAVEMPADDGIARVRERVPLGDRSTYDEVFFELRQTAPEVQRELALSLIPVISRGLSQSSVPENWLLLCAAPEFFEIDAIIGRASGEWDALVAETSSRPSIWRDMEACFAGAMDVAELLELHGVRALYYGPVKVSSGAGVTWAEGFYNRLVSQGNSPDPSWHAVCSKLASAFVHHRGPWLGAERDANVAGMASPRRVLQGSFDDPVVSGLVTLLTLPLAEMTFTYSVPETSLEPWKYGPLGDLAGLFVAARHGAVSTRQLKEAVEVRGFSRPISELILRWCRGEINFCGP